ncbi:hypothetical protein V2J09_012101 [Rumex salicifolius]
MNRSFRAQESLMPSIRSRVPQLRSMKEPTAKEKEDDLALFLEMRKREKEKNDLLLQNQEELDQSLVSQSGISPLFSIAPAAPTRKTCTEEFLNSENDKNDYDWLLTPPGTPLFPSLDMESRKAYLGETEAPNCHPTALKSRLANSQPEATVRSSLVSRQPTSSTGLNSSSSGLRRPSSSGGPGSRPTTPSGPVSRPATPSGPGSRPATPTGRPSLTTSSSRASRPSTPTSRPTLPSSRPAMTTSTRSTSLMSNRSTASTAPTKSTTVPRSSTPSRSTARSSTPTSRSTARSSTPTSRSTARSSTPTSRPTTTASIVPPARASSRPSTPTRRPSTPSRTTSGSSATSLTKSTSSVNKAGTGPLRSASPSVRPKPWKPSEMPGFSLDAPPNLRTTLPDRPLSATRGRPVANAARSASVEPVTNPGRQRRQSCSPSRGRAPNNGSYNHINRSSVPAVNRAHSRVNDEVSPVVMGNKMVERVINMRKLVPPKQDNKHSPSLSGKSASSPDNSGFGRTLSKKSLDMAIRHMDIRRTIPGNLRPLMTNIPASSMYSVRSGPARSRTVSVSDSPLATSSNASSDFSVNNMNAVGILDDDLCSGGAVSPTSLHGYGHFGSLSYAATTASGEAGGGTLSAFVDPPSLAAFVGRESLRWAGVSCFSLRSMCLIRERSVGFPGFGPWTTLIEGFFSLSFFAPFFSSEGTSFGMSSEIAFQ